MKKFNQKSIFIFSVLLIIPIALSVFSFLFFSQKIFRAKVLGVNVEQLTAEQATKKLSQELILPGVIDIKVQEQEFSIEIDKIDAKIDYQQTVENLYNYPRTGSISDRFKKVLAAVYSPYQSDPVITFDEHKLNENLSIIASQIYVQPVYPDISIVNNSLQIQQGEYGKKLDIDLLKSKIVSNLSLLSDEKILISPTRIGIKLNQQTQENIKNRYSNIETADIKVVSNDFEYKLSSEEILELIFEVNGTEQGPFTSLLSKLKPEIEQEAKNPVFIEDQGKVKEFEPSTLGIKIDRERFEKNLISSVLAASDSKQEVQVPTKVSHPEITTQDINNYGIKELIGYGESYYRGSIPERIHNVALAANKFDGILIGPGEIFSFNETVGDISVYTGFKQSYVIKGNETVLGDGGGVCQVSTTLFRASLDAGLQIVERRPHSYRVGYYEQGSPPGIDATIYSPTVDLKIKNDTGNYILVQTRIENNNKLIFELYGTDDGREPAISDPVITEIIDAPEDLYIDDPTLATGQIEQIDYKANGAKVYFDYKVVRDGETLFEKTFYSNYRPWQAKYLRGTGPAI